MDRLPQTTQERRASSRGEFVDEDGFRIKIRACRNQANLPNSYDDIPWFAERTWKKHRKTQYKFKKAS